MTRPSVVDFEAPGDTIRNHLSKSAATDTEFLDLDGDGTVTVVDIAWARRQVDERFGFHGRPIISYSGYGTSHDIYDFRARFYDPFLGRFMQRDPITYADSYNLYLAFEGNPLVFMDPSGKNPLLVALFGGVVGGIINGSMNYAQGGSFWAGAAGGFAGGFVGTLSAGALIGQVVLAGAVGGAASGGLSSGVTSLLEGHSAKRVVVDGVMGMAYGLLGGAITGGIVGNASSTISNRMGDAAGQFAGEAMSVIDSVVGWVGGAMWTGVVSSEWEYFEWYSE